MERREVEAKENSGDMREREDQKMLQLKLMVDDERKQLVYAECSRDMVDVLISFILTPVGAVVRRTGKDSGLGCMDVLYQSVENLSPSHFKTPACQHLLLCPRNAWSFAYHQLKLQINDVKEVSYCCPANYRCPFDVLMRTKLMAIMPGAKCVCGRNMTEALPMAPPDPDNLDVVFVGKKLTNFILTDDLFITPYSAEFKSKLCTEAGIQDSARLHEHIVHVRPHQLLKLMKMCLISTTPLTDTFLPTNFVRKTPKTCKYTPIFMQKEIVPLKARRRWNWIPYAKISSKIEITVILNEGGNKILFAIGDRKFVDLLFSILTFPLGSISAAFSGHSTMWCIDNLHSAVKKLCYAGHIAPAKWCGQTRVKDEFLLNPPIALHHNCSNKLLKIGHPKPSLLRVARDHATGKDKPRYHFRSLWPINPKRTIPTLKDGGGYIKQPKAFIITDAFVVEPISNMADVTHLHQGLEKRKIVVGQKEALQLLGACLAYDDPLTRVFLKLE